MSTLGQRLKHLRSEKAGRPTQKEVADSIGYSRDTYANWENNRGEPDHDALRTLAAFYNCSIDFLLGATQVKAKATDLAEIINEPGITLQGEPLDETQRKELLLALNKLTSAPSVTGKVEVDEDIIDIVLEALNKAKENRKAGETKE